jgi:hypothetical protein
VEVVEEVIQVVLLLVQEEEPVVIGHLFQVEQN